MMRSFDHPTLLKVGRIPPAYSDKLAWQMAELCRLSYEKFEVKGTASLQCELSKGGFDLVETLSGRVVQAFLARRTDDDLYVLVFRGTELNWDDIKTDLNIKLVRIVSGAKSHLMHRGFTDAIESVANQIDYILSGIDTNNIYVTGHSLGGALAVAASVRLRTKNKLAACYTFGCPKVGDPDLDWNIATSVYRVVNGQDLVPRLPPSFSTPYQHVGDLRFLTPDSRMLRSPGRALDILQFMLCLLTFRNLKTHKISNYCENLAYVALRRLAEDKNG